jgi:hypothetical protein
MNVVNASTGDDGAHTLEWAYGFSAHSDHTREHIRKGDTGRTMASDAACAPVSWECRKDSVNAVLPNVERRS